MRHRLALPLLPLVALSCDRAPALSPYDAMPRLALTTVAEPCAARDDAPCQFVNAYVAAPAPDGRVAISDVPVRGELREFDASGRFARHVGRLGDGPGEYRLVLAAGYDSAGNLTVMDQRGMRVQRFDGTGRVIATTTAPFVPGLHDVRAMQGRVALFVLPGAPAIGDTVEPRVLLVDPAAGDTVALPAPPMPAVATGDGTITPISPPFTVAPLHRWAVSPDGGVLVADDARLLVRRRDGATPARTLVELAVPPRPVSAAELEAEVAGYGVVGGVTNTEMAAQMRRVRDEAVAAAATAHPMVTRLVVLEDGTLLTREGPRAAADSVRWNAFAADGSPTGYLLLPTSAEVKGGRLERMLVVWPGDDDVPRIAWLAARAAAPPT